MALPLPVLALEFAEPDTARTATVRPEHIDRTLERADVIIVATSGGKDSTAAFLSLLDRGVTRDRIQLWHHRIDGAEGESDLMDWACIPAYLRAFGAAFGVPVYFSWREGGFEREMLRQDARTAPVVFERPDGTLGRAGGLTGPLGTRRKFPQPGANMQTRWCSSALKMDVAATAICNTPEFRGKRIVMVTGERADESPNRARLAVLEPHKTDRRGSGLRQVDQYRPVHGWTARDVWAIIERYRVVTPPPYALNFGRVSCAACVFASKHQWATLRLIDPARFARIAAYEASFGVTIHRTMSVTQLADLGTPYSPLDPADVAAALSTTYDRPIIAPDEEWSLPAGAFGESTGPT